MYSCNISLKSDTQVHYTTKVKYFKCTWLLAEDRSSVKKKKARVDLFANFRDGSSSSTQTCQRALLCCLVQMTLHATKPCRSQLPTTDRPLEFWRQHATEYPVLSAVARRVYCISITTWLLLSRSHHHRRPLLSVCIEGRSNWACAMGSSGWLDQLLRKFWTVLWRACFWLT